MPGLIDALNIARTGMDVNRKSMEVTGNNVANVNTPGYSKQTAEAKPLPSVESGGLNFGQGVNVEEISRAQDIFIQDRLMGAEEEKGRTSAKSAPLAELEQVFGVEGDNLAHEVEKFFASWEDLATNPGGEVERAQVIQRGENLVSAFRDVHENLDMVEGNVNESLRSRVEEVNGKLEEVAQLNTQIAGAQATGGEPHSALDQRDLLLRDLSRELGVNSYKGKNDMVSVALPGGQVLVQGEEAHQLKEDKGDILLETGKLESELNRGDFGGAFEGLLEVREDTISRVRDQVETLRKDLMESINHQHEQGYDLNGDEGEEFFSQQNDSPYNMEVALEDTSEVAAAKDPEGPPGDNRNAQEMANLADKRIVEEGVEDTVEEDGSFTFVDYYSKISGEVGIEMNQNEMRRESSEDSLSQLKNRRESREGVSLQDAMLDMTRYQRGFQAAARHMSAVDEMMQSMLGIVR